MLPLNKMKKLSMIKKTPHLSQRNESYQRTVDKKYVSDISLMIFYHNRKTVVCKVIRYVIYSFIDNFICIDYLCILHKQLSDYDKTFEK